MPARSALAFADGKGTPVTHTFTPHGDLKDGVAAFRNLNATNPGASEMLTVGMRDTQSPAADYQLPGKAVSPRRYKIVLTLPVTYVDSTTTLTLIDFVNKHSYEALMHPRTTAQQAEDGRYLVGGFLLNGSTAVVDTHDLGIPFW